MSDEDVETGTLTTYRYPKPMLLSDGFRSAAGIALTIGPLIFLPVAKPLAFVLGGIGSVFALFALRVMMQGVTSIELSSHGITRQGPSRRFLAWNDLLALKLAYYAPARRRSKGWYQLTLAGVGHRLKLESTIDGFDDIVRAALKAASEGGLVVDPATSANLAALGHQERRLRVEP